MDLQYNFSLPKVLTWWFQSNRSVSINSVSPASQQNSGLSFKERSKSVSERGMEIFYQCLKVFYKTLLLVSDSAFSFAAERRRSKKCSIFDTISENVVTFKEAEKYQQQSVENITIPKIRKENAKYFHSLKRQLTLILNVELTTQCSWNYIWHFIEVLKESVHSRESQLWL